MRHGDGLFTRHLDTAGPKSRRLAQWFAGPEFALFPQTGPGLLLPRLNAPQPATAQQLLQQRAQIMCGPDPGLWCSLDPYNEGGGRSRGFDAHVLALL